MQSYVRYQNFITWAVDFILVVERLGARSTGEYHLLKYRPDQKELESIGNGVCFAILDQRCKGIYGTRYGDLCPLWLVLSP